MRPVAGGAAAIVPREHVDYSAVVGAALYNATTYFFWSESIALAVAGSFGAAAACSTWWLARELNALRARGKLADEDAGRPQIALTS